MSVPIVLLRRQRAAQALTKAPPPRRRAGPSPITRASHSTVVPVAARVEPIRVPKTSEAEVPSDPGFNCALHSAKAFGIATAYVTIGAFVGVWAVQTSLGVQNVRAIFVFRRTMSCLMLQLFESDRGIRDEDEEVPDGEVADDFFPDTSTARERG